MTSANIGTPEEHSIKDLHLYHLNPRVGDVEEIAASMQVNGIYKPLVVNRGTHTGRPMEVLAGNHSLKAMRLLAEQHPGDPQWTVAQCWVVDVDDQQASKIVLVDNRAADLGSYDDDTLAELLDTLHELDGTGYSLDDLLALQTEDAEDFEPEDDYDSGLDSFDARPCQACGYDTANNPEGLAPWRED